MTRLGDWQMLFDEKSPPRAPRPGETAVLELRLRVRSEQNERDGWHNEVKRKRQQRFQVAFAWNRAGLPRATFDAVPSRSGKTVVKCFTTSYPPKSVRLVRLAQRQLDDDNLPGSFKHVRDEIAELLGFNDRLKIWSYDDQSSETRAIRIEVTWP